MKNFTFHKTGEELVTMIRSLIVVLAIEACVVTLLVVVLVPMPWTIISTAGALALDILGLLYLRSFITSRHVLDDETFTLAFGRRRVVIPTRVLIGAKRLETSIPKDVSIPTHDPNWYQDNSTVYMLAGTKNLVEISLADKGFLPAKGPHADGAPFTRVVVSVDEPDELIATIAERATRAAKSAASATPSASAPNAAETGSTKTQKPAEFGHVGLSLRGLARSFGEFRAVKGIDLQIRRGEIVAFLGSNGAGKTTTIKMIVGLLKPTEGNVCVNGEDVWTQGSQSRRSLGYVPDIPLLHEGLTAREFLWLVSGLYRLPRREARPRVKELLAFLKMERHGDRLIRDFSLGMKRRMAIGAALIHKPDVLLLDEVTNGLDPRATRDVKDFILQTARQGTGVMLTTHVLDVAEDIADRIAIIEDGQICALGTLDELRTDLGRPEARLEEIFLHLTGNQNQVEQIPAAV